MRLRLSALLLYQTRITFSKQLPLFHYIWCHIWQYQHMRRLLYKYPISFETASQLNPGLIMFVNRTVSTEYLKHFRLMHGDVKVGVKNPNSQGLGPIRTWQTTTTKIELSTSSVCLVTALYIQNNLGVMADLIHFQKRNSEYQPVMLEKVDLTHEDPHHLFFNITDYNFIFNRDIQITAQGEVKTLHAGNDATDLDVNQWDKVFDFFDEERTRAR